MDDARSRAIHVLAVVLWIGGVAMVTTVLLPVVRRFKSSNERIAFFATIERRFSWQARAANEVGLLSEAPHLQVYLEEMLTRPKAPSRIAEALASIARL